MGTKKERLVTPMLRLATPDDAEVMRAIYAQYIDTSITFEYALPSAEEFRGRVEGVLRDYPWLVWEEDGRILGYAYAHLYRERAAYQWGAELSVYIDREARGRGLGSVLYKALIELLRRQGVRAVYGFVTQPNEPSDRLHLSLGFTAAGSLRHAGFKNGRWHDVATYEKLIGSFEGAPTPIRRLGELDLPDLEGIL